MPQNRHVLRLIARLAAAVFILTTLAAPASAQVLEPRSYYATPNPAPGATCIMSDPCTLQSAVDHAAAGDTVYLKGGSEKYTSTAGSVVEIGRSILIQGGWDGVVRQEPLVDPLEYPSVLDGQGVRMVVYIYQNSSPTLRGLTIQNGYTDYSGAGVYINNTGSVDVTIEQSYLMGNRAMNYGGAVSLQHGTLIIRRSTITGNSATYGGGFIYAARGTKVIMERNWISGNSAQYGACGDFDNASVVARSNIIAGNANYPNSTTVLVSGNIAGEYVFENNIIAGNTGSGVAISSGDGLVVTFLHNTLVNNSNSGLMLPVKTAGIIANNIFMGHHYESLYIGNSSTATVSNNLFWMNEKITVEGENAVKEDPILIGYYQLSPNSPAINAGIPTDVTVDIGGERRPVGLPDIGVDEYQLPHYIPLVER